MIFCDTKLQCSSLKNNKRTSASRLMDVKYLLVRDQVIDVEYISTHLMVADQVKDGNC